MIRDGQVPVVGQQGMVGAKEPPDVGRVEDRRVEVRVVAHLDRHLHLGVAHGDERAGLGSRAVSAQNLADTLSKQCDRPTTQRHHVIER